MYKVMFFEAESPQHLENFLHKMWLDGYKLLACNGSYYIFEQVM